MTNTIASLTSVTETPAAEPVDAAEHFARLLQFETDCWDVHQSLAAEDLGFVLLDVRPPQQFQAGHIERAINLPYGKINERNLASYAADTLFVVYCNGTHCNGADKAALRLSKIGRRVKKMLGGIQGWKDSGFRLVTG